ncbi:DUF2887 domain-containing protein [uncultured Lamprocystis sp.]|jgi:predicted transposase YdaD|uniref:DUF2887 domain-containing protein n=1 Tax=uncultured Lamprocystis sp. TaxID=543132 RepID=UPI0025CC570B|nr:DUF2887 domain-containing protein [uncultured Lamprocystis sp.]
MKTDPSIYEFLATGAEAFRVLSGGVTLQGAYRFNSLTIKGIERRLDGIYEPEGHDGPVYVIEFQAQHAAGAWYNLLTKLGLYGQVHPRRTVQGLLIFLHLGDDPGAPPGAVPPLCTAAYLDELLPRWLEREPDNPFVVVFAPLIIARDDALRTYAPRALRTIREAPLAPVTRATLERMLEFWLIERFPLLSSEELRTMLNVLVPLEQTRVYQEIFAKGKADGLKRLLTRRFGLLPRWAVQRLDAAAIVQLDAWLEGVLDAQSLEQLIGPKPPGRAARKGA